MHLARQENPSKYQGKILNKTMIRDWFGISVILSLIAIPTLMAIHSYPQYYEIQRIAPFVYAAPTCAYSIKKIDGALVPFDLRGEQIGFFERYEDGTVQLTTPYGYAPKANECIKRSGFDQLVGSVRPYMRPAT